MCLYLCIDTSRDFNDGKKLCTGKYADMKPTHIDTQLTNTNTCWINCCCCCFILLQSVCMLCHASIYFIDRLKCTFFNLLFNAYNVVYVVTRYTHITLCRLYHSNSSAINLLLFSSHFSCEFFLNSNQFLN